MPLAATTKFNTMIESIPSAQKRDMSIDVNEVKNKSRLSDAMAREKNDVITARVTNASKSPDKYYIGGNLVVTLNDSTV